MLTPQQIARMTPNELAAHNRALDESRARIAAAEPTQKELKDRLAARMLEISGEHLTAMAIEADRKRRLAEFVQAHPHLAIMAMQTVDAKPPEAPPKQLGGYRASAESSD